MASDVQVLLLWNEQLRRDNEALRQELCEYKRRAARVRIGAMASSSPKRPAYASRCPVHRRYLCGCQVERMEEVDAGVCTVSLSDGNAPSTRSSDQKALQ